MTRLENEPGEEEPGKAVPEEPEKAEPEEPETAGRSARRSTRSTALATDWWSCYGRIELWVLRIRVVSDPGPRTPEGTGGWGGDGVMA